MQPEMTIQVFYVIAKSKGQEPTAVINKPRFSVLTAVN